MSNELFLRSFKLPRPLFSSKSAWNECVNGVAVQAESTATLQKMYDYFIEKQIWPTIGVSHETYTYPIFPTSLASDQLVDLQARAYRGEEWAPVMLPWYRTSNGSVFVRAAPRCATSVRPSGPQDLDSDGSVILFNVNTNEEYDFWQATTVLDGRGETLGGGHVGPEILRAGGIAYFHTDGLGTQLPVCDARSPSTLPRGSCRASGVPYLAGLFVPEDLARGACSKIEHALAFVMRRLRHTPCATMQDPPDYVYPATRTETSNFSRDPLALAAGQRLRLKKELFDDTGMPVDESDRNPHLAPITRIFFCALRQFGAYLVDGGSGFAFSAEDYHTAWLDLKCEEVNELIGEPRDKALPEGKTKWQVVLEKLNEQLSWEVGGGAGHGISLAAQLPDASLVPNFEVVENAKPPDVNWQRRVGEDGDVECP